MASSLNGTGLTFSSGQTLNSPPVTSITASGGLTGGTITTTGTIAVDTSTWAIGQVITGRPKVATSYSVGSTVAGSSLYAAPGGMFYVPGYYGSDFNMYIPIGNIYMPGTLVNTGTWKALSPSNWQTLSCWAGGVVNTWIRIS